MDNNKNPLNVLQWNARSILPKKHFLQNFLQQHKINVAAICETWLAEGSSFSIQGYDILRHDRQDGFGGVLLAIDKNLQYDIVKFSSPVQTQMEYITVNVITKCNGQKLQITVAYDGSFSRLDLENLKKQFEHLQSPSLILGDFNAHHNSWGDHTNDQRGRVMMEFLDELNLVHLNDGTLTRIPRPPSRGSAIDISLTSISNRFDFDWQVLDDTAGSDHNPILIS
jgi:exonuclease III